MPAEKMDLGAGVQVYFRFDPTATWPPVPSEGLWAVPVGDGAYRVQETPFFVRNTALGDVVAAADDGSGTLWAAERRSWGGHQTVRVNPRAGGPTCAEVLIELEALGARGEELEEYRLLTLDVPPGVVCRPLRELLVAGAASDRWWFEEACIGAGWTV